MLDERFTLDVEADDTVFLPRSVADPIFRQLFLNVVHHHSRDQGRIRVRSARQGAFVRVSVADDGDGIGPEHWETVFGVFSTLSNKAERPGLGLALVRRAVESQGGEVWIEDSTSEGTTFVITLPADASIDSAQAGAARR